MGVIDDLTNTCDRRPGASLCRWRLPLTTAELAALSAVCTAVVGFGAHGTVNDVPGTVEYVVTVSVLTAVVFALRKRALSSLLAAALAAVAIVHLAGGLVQIGGDVLYNASPGVDLFRYDHFAHALGIFVGTMLLWELLIRGAVERSRRGHLVTVALLAGLGLGALNETIEFLATLAHGGESHVGGYTNTGWDLVANLIAGMVAGLVLHRRQGADIARSENDGS